MSYLTDLGNTLAMKLTALPEAERNELITFVKTEVLTSYRNGQRDADKKTRPTGKTEERVSKRDPKGHTAPKERRNYQHR